MVLRLRGAYLALFTLAFGEIARRIVIADGGRDHGRERLSLAVGQLPGRRRDHYYLLAGVLAPGARADLPRHRIAVRTLPAGDARGRGRRRRDGRGHRAAQGRGVQLRVAPARASRHQRTTTLRPAVDAGDPGPAGDGAGRRLRRCRRAWRARWRVRSRRRSSSGCSTPSGSSTSVPMHIEPGVWRYAVFGALLVLTLRLAPNGLIAPPVARIGRGGRAARDAESPGRSRRSCRAQEPHDGRLGPRRGRRRRAVRSISGPRAWSCGSAGWPRSTARRCDGPTADRGLIGPNGAGKTTLVNVVSGYYDRQAARSSSGASGSTGCDRTRWCDGGSAGRSRSRGDGAVDRPGEPPGAGAGDPRRGRPRGRGPGAPALDTVNLAHLADEYARSLSGGQQKLLELARLVMLDRDILVLDEPFAGVHPVLRRSIGDLRQLREDGRAVLLIEHDSATVFSLCERLVVLERRGGRRRRSGAGKTGPPRDRRLPRPQTDSGRRGTSPAWPEPSDA